MIHDSGENDWFAECGCSKIQKSIRFCGTGFQLVVLQGKESEPCRFRYVGGGGENNRLYHSSWPKAAAETYYIGGYCDRYPKYAFGDWVA